MIRNTLAQKIVFLTLLQALVACESERDQKYNSLAHEAKIIFASEAKRDIIFGMVCSNFHDEIIEYKKDKKNKEFSYNRNYFWEYPHQFEILQSSALYDLSKVLVGNRLSLRGVKDADPDFRDMKAPSLDELPCKKILQDWQREKSEWDSIKHTIPSNFYKQDSFWDEITYFADDFVDLLSRAFFSVFIVLIICGLTVCSIILHFLLLVKRNIEGLWLVLATPLSALYWQKHLPSMFFIEENLAWKILTTSIFLIFIYGSIAVICGKYIFKSIPNRKSLDEAINRGNPKAVEDILKKNRNLIFDFDEDGLAPIHTLVKKGRNISTRDSSIAATLIKFGANVNQRTDCDLGWSPLHFIASQGSETSEKHAHLAKTILEAGADPDVRSAEGWTPLHIIAINGSQQSLVVLQELIENKANPFATSDDGATSWRVLWQHGKEIYDALDAYERHYLVG